MPCSFQSPFLLVECTCDGERWSSRSGRSVEAGSWEEMARGAGTPQQWAPHPRRAVLPPRCKAKLLLYLSHCFKVPLIESSLTCFLTNMDANKEMMRTSIYRFFKCALENHFQGYNWLKWWGILQIQIYNSSNSDAITTPAISHWLMFLCERWVPKTKTKKNPRSVNKLEITTHKLED